MFRMMESDALADQAVQAANRSRKGTKPPRRIILADFDTNLWQHDGVWVHVKEETLSEFKESVLKVLESPKPLHISILALQNYTNDTIEDLLSCVRNIMEATLESTHKVCFSTLRFLPEEERNWNLINSVNKGIKVIMSEFNVQQLNLHKICLKFQGRDLVVDAECFKEFIERTSLGSTLSEHAINTICDWLNKHNNSAFGAQPILRARGETESLLPLPLGLTKSYYEDERMVSFLKSRGLYHRRPRSETRKPPHRRVSHRTISRRRPDSLGTGHRDGRSRSPMAVGALERLLSAVSRDRRGNPTNHVMNRDNNFADRINQLYLQKNAEVVQLNICVEALKAEVHHLRQELEREKSKTKEENGIEIHRLKQEIASLQEHNRNLSTLDEHNDKLISRLMKMKSDLGVENNQLVEELGRLKLSKKERRRLKREQRQEDRRERY